MDVEESSRATRAQRERCGNKDRPIACSLVPLLPGDLQRGPAGSHPLLIIYDYHRARLACRHTSILECIMMVTEYGSHATGKRWANIFSEREKCVVRSHDTAATHPGCIMMVTEDGSRLSGTSRMIISTVAHLYSRLPP